jgi:lauroyl/myristoyl acyltransferase
MEYLKLNLGKHDIYMLFYMHSGTYEYMCIYIHNAHILDIYINFKVKILHQNVHQQRYLRGVLCADERKYTWQSNLFNAFDDTVF